MIGEQMTSDFSTIGVGSESFLESDLLEINWTLTRRCNYNCSYCRVYDNSRNYFHSLEKLKVAIDKISLISGKEINCTLSGGEPTLHPEFVEFIKYFIIKVKQLKRILIITNLSHNEKFYHNFCNSLKEHSKFVSFKASYHMEFANIDKFLKNVQIIANNHFLVRVSVMAHPQYMEDVKKVYQIIQNASKSLSFLICDVIVIRENHETQPDNRYTEDDLTWLQSISMDKGAEYIYFDYINDRKEILREYSTPSELVSSGRNSFKGMYCNAGINMLSISSEGDIDPAICFQRLRARKKNIYVEREALTVYSKPLICPFERCGCLADIQIPKFLDGYGSNYVVQAKEAGDYRA